MSRKRAGKRSSRFQRRIREAAREGYKAGYRRGASELRERVVSRAEAEGRRILHAYLAEGHTRDGVADEFSAIARISPRRTATEWYERFLEELGCDECRAGELVVASERICRGTQLSLEMALHLVLVEKSDARNGEIGAEQASQADEQASSA
jgi:hypothetical protein